MAGAGERIQEKVGVDTAGTCREDEVGIGMSWALHEGYCEGVGVDEDEG